MSNCYSLWNLNNSWNYESFTTNEEIIIQKTDLWFYQQKIILYGKKTTFHSILSSFAWPHPHLMLKCHTVSIVHCSISLFEMLSQFKQNWFLDKKPDQSDQSGYIVCIFLRLQFSRLQSKERKTSLEKCSLAECVWIVSIMTYGLSWLCECHHCMATTSAVLKHNTIF